MARRKRVMRGRVHGKHYNLHLPKIVNKASKKEYNRIYYAKIERKRRYENEV
jgi:hypothetical protein